MVKVSQLLKGVTATQLISASLAFMKTTRARKSFIASGITTAGAGSATVLVEATNDISAADPGWITVATLSLTLATTKAAGTQAGYATDAAYEAFRMRVTAITGTGAAVDGLAAN